MQQRHRQLQSVMAEADRRRMPRIWSGALVACLLAALLWLTKWPSLRLGLAVLLLAQASATFLLWRRHRAAARAEPELHWFDEEAAFTSRLAIIETGGRTLGFLLLAFGFWQATRNVAIAVVLGIVYPLVAFFGMERRQYQRMQRRLRIEKDALATSTIDD